MQPKTPQRKTARAPTGISSHNEQYLQPRNYSSRKGHEQSDSHDLNLHNVTRDSMVENMLSSFDKIPEPDSLYDRIDHDIPGLAPVEYNLMSNYDFDTVHRHRQLSQDSSFASEYSLHAELPEHYRIVPQRPLRRDDETLRRLSPEKVRQPVLDQAEVRQLHEHSPQSPIRSRKSSSASNIEAGSNNLKKSRLSRRSRQSSVDENTDPKSSGQLRMIPMSNSILDRARPVPVEYHNFDGASIPGLVPDDRPLYGPTGGIPFSAFSPQPSYEIPPRGSSHTNNPRNQDGNRTRLTHLRVNGAKSREVANLDRSPSFPNVLDGLPSRPGESVKEKHGFFKRVFGSSRITAPGVDVAPQLPPLVLRRDVSSSSMKPCVETLAPLMVPKAGSYSLSNAELTNTIVPPPPIPDEQVLVVKKKSSFFARNRKKTAADNVAPPSQLEIARAAVAAEFILPSHPSANSLQKPVPSISTKEAASPEEQFFDSREEQLSGIADNDETIFGSSQWSTSAPAHARDTPSVKDNPASRGHVASSRPDNSRKFSASKPQTLNSVMQPGISRGNDETILHTENFSRQIEMPSSPVSATKSASLGNKISLSNTPLATSGSGKASISVPLLDISNRNTATTRDLPVSQPSTSSYSPGTKEQRTSQNHEAKSAAFSSEIQDHDWVRATPTKIKENNATSSSGAGRVWLQPSGSDENLAAMDSLPLPPEGAAGFQLAAASPTADDFVSATASPVIQIEGQNFDSTAQPRTAECSEPSAKDHEIAAKIFHGCDDFIGQSKGILLLGDSSLSSARVRKSYLDLFDFSGLNILAALRKLCGKLVMKGETQQVDRILAAFSVRWCECNPNHGFKSKDVVHTICYSILLLNTDLHIADMDTKMTRSQFVKNTLPTIRRVAADGNDENNLKANTLLTKGSSPWRQPRSPSPVSPGMSPLPPESRESLEMRTPAFRLSMRPPKTDIDHSSPVPNEPTDISDNLVGAPFDGTSKAWEFQIETALKDIYAAIRQERLPLHSSSEVQLREQPSHNSLSIANSTPRRTGSINSKAPSDGYNSRSRGHDLRSLSNRFMAKNRSRTKVYGTSTVGSSRTSLDDSSMWSPNASSTWSRSVFGKTQTTMSTDSLGSHLTHGDYGYQQSIGFANALSQSIIREDSANQLFLEDPGNMVTPLLEDESLELAGAPWAKEGIVHHKHHLITTEKKAKDRNWDECFAVVEKGYMKLFSFNSKATVRSQKKAHGKGSVVGGGNWMDNAENVGSFLLRQTIANALPPPGYSKTRPHVFALSLPTGAVHLFNVGTPEIAKEFVSTANYWSARLSKEPLIGSVSNIEYGWSDAVINTALIRNDVRIGAQSSASNNYPHSISHSSRPSFQGSMRSSIDHGSTKTRLPGDKITLSEWKPPQQSLLASTLKEAEQLEGLQKYVKDVEEELSIHNELRPPMLLAFTPSHPNARKAMSNWERKSSYLLREIVKFRTYIESLKAAKIAKERYDAAKGTATVFGISDVAGLKIANPVVDENNTSRYRTATSKERLAEAAAAVVAR